MAAPERRLDAIVLAGGRGTRLQSVVRDVPKPLALVGGRPFLDYQLQLLASSGRVRQVVLAVGHLADRIIEHYTQHPPPLPVDFVVEHALLGTGGAARNALDATTSDRVLVLNGDSVFRWDLDALAEVHASLRPEATLSLVRVGDVGRYGSVVVEEGRIRTFVEKGGPGGPGLINAGVYLFERETLGAIASGCVTSLETDVFPVLAARGALAAAQFDSPFIDIGLPETYKAAPTVLESMAASHGPAAPKP